jgi:[acyl-carrier-protein] S-malonyltransferase
MESTVAFVFPGQGSQHLGMLSDLASVYPSIVKTFDTVSERLGYDLWELTQRGPEAKLSLTEHTQAVVLTADVAIYELLAPRLTFKPAMMAGHSLGEYAALVCAGAISLPDAAELVAKRGSLMQETVPLGRGAMAAIVGLPDDKVAELCQQVSTNLELVSPANYNATGQVVIAGHTPAVERAISSAEALGARMAKIIPVSVPCHCSLLTEAAERFEDYLQKASFMAPKIPVMSNVDLSVYESPEQIKRLLKEQLYRPVRWVETIQTMKQKGIDTIVECGPGRVLSGLIKRIDSSLTPMSVNDSSSLELVFKQVIERYEREQL